MTSSRLVALTREVSPKLGECELSFQARTTMDVDVARAQHAAYREALAALGARVVLLPTLADHADCVFVEDTAIVLDEVAIMTRPGAESRRGESASIAEALGAYRTLRHLEAPATLDGGDVLRVGKTLYVGLSRRTNAAGIQQLAKAVEPYGYWITPVEVRGCLHLKSACSYVGNGTLLVNRAWVDMDAFCSVRLLDVPAEEPHGANVLWINDTALVPSSYPETRALLEAEGIATYVVDTSELMKAEAGVTCMNLLIALVPDGIGE
jgi:dimethylargininase